MGGVRKKLALACAAVATVAALGGAAEGAIVKVGPLILHAEGGFSPTVLPKHGFAAIDFHGEADIKRKGGGVPPALQRAVIQFDRDGRLDTKGLPTCSAETVATATPRQARVACAGALVGKGSVAARIEVPLIGSIQVRSPLSVFNGPRLKGARTMILHAQFSIPPLAQTLAIVVPLERRAGQGYRATIEMPPIAGGLGSLTRIQAKIGRHFTSGGVRHSYVSARCSDGILETHGSFTFAEELTVSGSVYAYCRAR